MLSEVGFEKARLAAGFGSYRRRSRKQPGGPATGRNALEPDTKQTWLTAGNEVISEATLRLRARFPRLVVLVDDPDR